MTGTERPVSADKSPKAVNLEADKTYYWCACGKSANQPFCDGSHRGSSFSPTAFTPNKGGENYLCMCKMTKNPPYCDGSHRTLA